MPLVTDSEILYPPDWKPDRQPAAGSSALSPWVIFLVGGFFGFVLRSLLLLGM